jgi:hypothetical protein
VEIILELLAQFLMELLFHGVLEMLGRGVGRGLASATKKDSAPFNPLLEVCCYVLMGAIAGGVSLWLVPLHLLKTPTLQILGLVITPTILGFLFELFGRWKTTNDKPRYMLDRFSYGFTFALTMGLIRFFFAG